MPCRLQPTPPDVWAQCPVSGDGLRAEASLGFLTVGPAAPLLTDPIPQTVREHTGVSPIDQDVAGAGSYTAHAKSSKAVGQGSSVPKACKIIGLKKSPPFQIPRLEQEGGDGL